MADPWRKPVAEFVVLWHPLEDKAAELAWKAAEEDILGLASWMER